MGDESAIFQLFIGLTMFQARRDVLIMVRQRQCSRHQVEQMFSRTALHQQIAVSTCPALKGSESFVSGCSVRKKSGVVTCDHGDRFCLIRKASEWYRRFGDHGKLPMSAYLQFGESGRISSLLADVTRASPCPSHRAELLVERFGRVYRVGEKLATLFVSMLSTPALTPGLSPWFPVIDGNALVVVDTHAARLIDHFRKGKGSRTYNARASWLRQRAKAINLSAYHPLLPIYSPRLIQQALYAYGSSSNRSAWGEPIIEKQRVLRRSL